MGVYPLQNPHFYNFALSLETLTNVIICPILITQSVPYSIFSLNNVLRQTLSDSKEHKECPLPPKGIDNNTEGEPPD
jgi:hypothetical protein